MQKTQLTSIDKTAPYEMPRNIWIIMTVRLYLATHEEYTRKK